MWMECCSTIPLLLSYSTSCHVSCTAGRGGWEPSLATPLPHLVPAEPRGVGLQADLVASRELREGEQQQHQQQQQQQQRQGGGGGAVRRLRGRHQPVPAR